MNLRDFISETLTQIIGGVTDAQKAAVEMGGKVSPKLSGSTNYASDHGFLSAQGGSAQVVRFDVALTVKEGTGTKGGIGIVAGIVSLGSTGQSNAESSSVSRVQFSVPVTLPSAL
ncbi:hypothetical protein [Povalibacter sp.]|uniref:hypothetical protein n=1 Tax=Povalibacter sp. TaxID=1962978 RepID=UPI002F42B2B4